MLPEYERIEKQNCKFDEIFLDFIRSPVYNEG